MNDPADGPAQRSREQTEAPRSAGFASLYRLPQVLVVVTYDRTTAGFHIAADRVKGLPVDSDPDVLGGVLLIALAASRDGVPVPDWNAPLRERVGPTLKAAGYRSYRSFVLDALCAGVTRTGDTVTFTPTRNGGPTGPQRGFEDLPGRAQSCSALPAEIGRAAIAALDHATPWSCQK
jgi:hypothetical protein